MFSSLEAQIRVGIFINIIRFVFIKILCLCAQGYFLILIKVTRKLLDEILALCIVKKRCSSPVLKDQSHELERGVPYIINYSQQSSGLFSSGPHIFIMVTVYYTDVLLFFVLETFLVSYCYFLPSCVPIQTSVSLVSLVNELPPLFTAEEQKGESARAAGGDAEVGYVPHLADGMCFTF